ncbi:MAG: 23S rRNA (uracil(1939)-C(5))-methyltransferase RlmD [Actinobacteria bacterium]|nr:23S rRNA (uracil(1939)-C(5))-methyltransferase RlmD [Actinomycetota bacterium]
MAKSDLPVKKGEVVSLDIGGLTHNGEGVGRCRGLAVFVPGAVPGDAVLAEIVKQQKNYAVGRLLDIREKSGFRREPQCSLFGSCGGCRLQNMGYREQLRLKTALVRDSLSRLAGMGDAVVRDMMGMENPRHYRNKAHFQVEEQAGGFRLGFYGEGSHSLSAVFGGEQSRGCLLVDSDLNKTASKIEALLDRYGREKAGRGFFRHVILRKAYNTGEIMAVLVTRSGDWPGQEGFAEELARAGGRVVSLVRNINDGPPGAVLGKKSIILAGKGYVTDRLGELSFIISPASFYQVNPVQTLVLYRKALEYAGLKTPGDLTVVDAYSGVGTIALFMAGQARRVVALEVVPEAVEDARRNGEMNGIDNIEFHTGEVEKLLPSLAGRGLRPDVAVLDPPRKGCVPEVLQAVAEMGTPRVVYVSCHPGTLARDLSRLAALGYRVEEVQPVDMFPWTHHIENCVLLSKK